LVIAWTLLVTPLFRSEALLQVEPEQKMPGLADAMSSMPAAPLLGLGKDEIETRIGVLRSRRVVDAVIDSLALTARVADASHPRAALVDVSMVPADSAEDVEGTLVFSRTDAGWAIAAEDFDEGITVPEALAAGDTLTLGAMHIVPRVRDAEVRRFELELRPRYVARRELLDRLEVRRQSAGAQLIALTFDDPDPEMAAAVLRHVLSEFMSYTAGAARGDAGTTAAELRRQIEEQRAQLTAAEEAQRAYQERTGVVMPSEQGAAEVERYANLRTALDQQEVEREALSRLLRIVEGRSADPDVTAGYRQLATFPSLISNRAIQDLLVTLTSLENDRSTLRLARSDANADVRQLTVRIGEVERQLQTLGRQYLESLDEQIASAKAAVQDIDRTISELPERELRFVRLARASAVLNEGYMFLLKQLRQTELQDALRLDAVRIVDAPSVADPDDPYFPRPLVNLVLGVVLAVAGGGAVAAVQSARRATTAQTPATDA
jgi:tyrosine-protein kinase Etk/Wzc